MGPVLAEVRAGLGMSSVTAGLLTSLPVLAFAVFGALAPWLAATVGVHRVTALQREPLQQLPRLPAPQLPQVDAVEPELAQKPHRQAHGTTQ